MPAVSEDQLAAAVRRRAISPEEALSLLQDDLVYVYDEFPLNDETATYEEVEERGAAFSDLQHSLSLAGATPQLKSQISAEIVRLRERGLTLDAEGSSTKEEV